MAECFLVKRGEEFDFSNCNFKNVECTDYETTSYGSHSYFSIPETINRSQIKAFIMYMGDNSGITYPAEYALYSGDGTLVDTWSTNEYDDGINNYPFLSPLMFEYPKVYVPESGYANSRFGVIIVY